ncbi:MAG: DEAD/DEAH box helicase family protein [Flavobacteriales bacterium]|nr:DEAD/DEAH box helicase family protein [Flavobacteriales bacterium]
MEQFPEGIEFKYSWRTYQARVLSELRHHLDDNHLHVVAPPGSGKTVLGLEVALRLNKPTLILAPTLAIKNQWVSRFCELFLQTDIEPDWISRDIKNPKFLTVATYQSLHAAYTGLKENEGSEEELEEELEEEEKLELEEEGVLASGGFISALVSVSLGTIVVDEAHHLKNAWWKSLTAVKDALKPTIVGLTATPPFDVSYQEWKRYLELNGPVDTEIPVPELVAEGDLCPHQDYVHFSFPNQAEIERIEAIREKIDGAISELKSDIDFINILKSLPIINRPLDNLDWIYGNMDEYSSCIIFLNSIGEEISLDHYNVVSEGPASFPELDLEWLETLLAFFLYSKEPMFFKHEKFKEKLRNKLRSRSVLQGTSIRLKENKHINRSLSTSLSKLDSIVEITQFEHKSLKEELREVILTDYIRAEYLVNSPTNDLKIDKIGVVSIFERLRRERLASLELGVLSGSVVIIPVSALARFLELAQQKGIEDITSIPLPYDEEYVRIITSERLKHHLVQLTTQVFEEGCFQVLVGSKSLLGEGWDAPSVNTLILASFVGSYVLSNQMRGRAIRKDRSYTEKTGNIWHLVCVDPTREDGGQDLELLERRLSGFIGVAHGNEPRIENGTKRLNIPKKELDEESLTRFNQQMLLEASARNTLKLNWVTALNHGSVLIEEVQLPFASDKDKSYAELRTMYYRNTIASVIGLLMIMMTFSAELFFQTVMHSFVSSIHPKTWIAYMLVFAGICISLFAGMLFRSARMYLRYRDITKDLHNIAEALVDSLCESKAFQSRRWDITVVSHVDHSGAIHCHINGGSTYEKSLFVNSLMEIVGVIDNPRYIIVRKSKLFGVKSQQDFHSVPEVLGAKKKTAVGFESNWKTNVGDCELVYTRTIAGRQRLLKSRMKSLSAQFVPPVERMSRWS